MVQYFYNISFYISFHKNKIFLSFNEMDGRFFFDVTKTVTSTTLNYNILFYLSIVFVFYESKIYYTAIVSADTRNGLFEIF